MPRLIDKDELKKAIQENICQVMCDEPRGCSYCRVDDVWDVIYEQPIVDAEPVVRCKDCKWGTPHPEGDEYTQCFKLCTTFFSGHYCAWGERRENAETN